MKKHRTRRIYVDTTVMSVYVSPKSQHNHAVVGLLSMAKANGFELLSLRLIRDEAEEGTPGRAKKRLRAIKQWIDYVPWTPAVKSHAKTLLDKLDKNQRKALFDDAHHYAAAVIHEIPYLLTTDDDFKHLESLRPRSWFKPQCVLPVEMSYILTTSKAWAENPRKKGKFVSFYDNFRLSKFDRKLVNEIRAIRLRRGTAAIEKLQKAGKW